MCANNLHHCIKIFMNDFYDFFKKSAIVSLVPAWQRFLKRNIYHVMFAFYHRILSNSLDGKISQSFEIGWLQLVHAWQKNKHDMAEISIFLFLSEGNIQKPLLSSELVFAFVCLHHSDSTYHQHSFINLFSLKHQRLIDILLYSTFALFFGITPC